MTTHLDISFEFHLQYDRWYACNYVEGALDVATELSLSTFNLCASNYPFERQYVEMRREFDLSLFTESTKALKALLCQSPQHFSSNNAISALGGMKKL